MTMTLTNCTITDPDGYADLEGAVVVVSGDSPHATIRIAERDPQVKKFRTFDRILDASINAAGKQGWTIEGTSEHLRSEIGTADSRVSLTVKAKGGCQGCR